MAFVTGYIISLDTGASGPSVGDEVSGTTSSNFETVDYAPTGDATVNFPSLGDVYGVFYNVGGTDYFVPEDDSAFPIGETGNVDTYSDAILGSTGGDTLTGSADGDLIQDTDGDLWGATGSDTINAGGGDDTILYGDGNDVIHGGDGDDAIGTWDAGAGNNTIYGDAGNDYIIGGLGDDTIYGGIGNDVLSGSGGTDVLYGNEGNDEFLITDDHDITTIYGGDEGGDTDFVWFGNYETNIGITVTWDGDESADYSYIGTSTSGTFAEIEVVGGTGYADTLDASQSTAMVKILGEDGDDTITVGSGGSYVEGGAGDDTIIGGDGSDEMVGGAGADTFATGTGGGDDLIADFNMTDVGDGTTLDQIDVTDLKDADGSPVHAGDVAISDDGSGNTVLTFPSGETLTLNGVSPTGMSSSTLVSMGVPCFTAGTLIGTIDGEVPVEGLRQGDLVQTLDNGLQKLVWVGQRQLGQVELHLHPNRRPILIRQGTLGNVRDMLVSPQHGMVLNHDGEARLVRATHLARFGGPGFRRANGRRSVRYVHLLFEDHQIIFADGTPSESFLPGPMALAALEEKARDEVYGLFPELTQKRQAPSPILSTARAFLARRDVHKRMSQSFDYKQALS